MKIAVNISMRCCECNIAMADLYNLQIFSQKEDTWAVVCLQCWKHASFIHRSPMFFFASLYGTRIGKISRLLNPGMSWCYACKTTWQYVPNHTVMLTSSRGTFLFCEECWEKEPLHNKLQAYNKWWEQFSDRDYPWETMFEAVCADHAKLKKKEEHEEI